MVIFGNRLFGKVDAVPGLGFVATRFFHIDYVPVIPNQCWLVYQQKGKSWRGIRIPMSAKSVLLAWVRTLSVVGFVVGVIGLIASGGKAGSNPAALIECPALIVICASVFAFSKLHQSVTRASYARACQLAKLAKLDDRALLELAAVYGQPPVSYGFAPIISASRPRAEKELPDPSGVGAIPVEELDGEPTFPAKIGAVTPPRQESRRHG